MRSFHLNIIAPEREFFDGQATSLMVPTTQGYYGVLAGHANEIGAIVPGKLTMKDEQGKTIEAAVSNGMIRVEENDVLVLVDTIELPEEIDANRAQRAADRAREEMLQKKGKEEYLQAKAQMARALNRLKVKGRR